jgi:OCT family organic cation transporter-like MFS transporter 4/5
MLISFQLSSGLGWVDVDCITGCLQVLHQPHRSADGFSDNVHWPGLQVGEFLMVALAYALPNWQHLVLAAACVNVAALLLYPVVSESARWLLSQGRTDEATAILQRIAKGNSSSMPAQALVSSNSRKQLQPALEVIAEEGMCGAQVAATPDNAASESEPSLGLFQLLKERRLAIRLLVLLINWFSLMLNYYGIAMGSGGIPGSM